LKPSRVEITELSRLDYHVSGPMLENCHKLQPKPKTTDELKGTQQTIWEKLLQEHINMAVSNFIEHWIAYMAVAAIDGYFEHLQ